VLSSDVAPSEPAPLDGLTPREFDMLRLLVHGESVQAIAAQLTISPKTVLNTLTSVRQKLGADNDFRLMHMAARLGIVEFGGSVPA
jgi:DNA-binding CsgD family transcriptional regulator